MRAYLFANAIGISTAAFASYFDVYSHRHIFVGTDPWWNPAHLLLYAGFLIIAYGVARDRPRGALGKLSVVGIVLVLAAAAFNEVWHRVLLFGNPLPEPFPVEPTSIDTVVVGGKPTNSGEPSLDNSHTETSEDDATEVGPMAQTSPATVAIDPSKDL